MNKEIDALVAKCCIGGTDGNYAYADRVRDALLEARALGLEDAAKAAEDCAVTWMARAVALPMERDIDPEKAKLAKIAAGQIAHSIRALKGE